MSIVHVATSAQPAGRCMLVQTVQATVNLHSRHPDGAMKQGAAARAAPPVPVLRKRRRVVFDGPRRAPPDNTLPLLQLYLTLTSLTSNTTA